MLIHDSDPQAWTLKALREAGNSLVSELYGLDERTLRRRPADGEWSLKEIAAHMRDAEDLALKQMTAIIERRRGALPAWDVDLLPHERDYRAQALDNLLAAFRALRRETTQLLWSITDADWSAHAHHPYRGEITLGEIARELAQHDLEHLWQVRRLKHDLGAVPAARPEVSKGEREWTAGEPRWDSDWP
ncbi:MAG TPA: DinB family protein [Dehalococcoidia bacterium]|nr:DinB family protein [Dehalococcoidia bacterium]